MTVDRAHGLSAVQTADLGAGAACVLHPAAAEEIAWAQERTASPESLFALVLALKCFQKMARFCPLEEIPEAVTGHVRRCLGLDPETVPNAAWFRRRQSGESGRGCAERQDCACQRGQAKRVMRRG